MSKTKIQELHDQGLSNRQIAKELDVSVQYVWNALNPDYQKRYRQTKKFKEYNRTYMKEYLKRKKEESDDRHN